MTQLEKVHTKRNRMPQLQTIFESDFSSVVESQEQRAVVALRRSKANLLTMLTVLENGKQHEIFYVHAVYALNIWLNSLIDCDNHNCA